MNEKLHTAWEHLPRWAIYSAGALVVAAAAGYGGVGQYLSSQILTPAAQTVLYDQSVQNVQADTVRTQGGAYNIDGTVGLVRGDGKFVGELGPPTGSNVTDKASTRRFLGQPQADIAVGDHVSLQGNIWTSDPREALDVPFEEVEYAGPLGDMSAWVIPGQQPEAWTVAVHGNGGPKSELLRFVKPVLAAGNTMMVVNYRNDPGNPQSPDGFTHLGDTEWQDVQAAIKYAKEHGATTINLYGISVGGSVVQNYLRQAPPQEAAIVDKVILDSPVLDWKQLLEHRVKQRGLPGWLAKSGLVVAKLRSGVDFTRISTAPHSITHPTFIIHSSDDTVIPNGPSKTVAAAQPELVKFVDFGKGGHARSWNYDSQRYEQTVTAFLRLNAE
jgi:uncharacterized protein